MYVLLSQLIHVRGSGSAQLDSLRITRNETRVLSSLSEGPSFLVAIELHLCFCGMSAFILRFSLYLIPLLLARNDS